MTDKEAGATSETGDQLRLKGLKNPEAAGIETAKFAKKDNLDGILQDICYRAFKSKTNYPVVFIADEIYKISTLPPNNSKLVELRKNVSRLQALFEQLKDRNSDKKTSDTPSSDAAAYQAYEVKHNLRECRLQLIAFSFIADTKVEGRNPLTRIADLIYEQEGTKVMMDKEIVDLEKRHKIYTNLIQNLITDNPMNLKEIRDFSEKTVAREHQGAK